jgi:hypothetical protein
MTPPQAIIAEHLRWQAGECGRLGSPLYARLLNAAAIDTMEGGPCWDVLAGHEGDDPRSMPALRFLGAVHRLVLTGRAPDLAPFYGPEPTAADPWPPFRATVAANVDALRDGVLRGVQTNEVGRSAALVGGFLLVARDTGLPLRVLEMGASAGLNLRWDAFRYEAAASAWGDPASSVRLTGAYDREQPPFDVAATVAERRGCDRNPLDPSTYEGRVMLLSFVWPDQRQRSELMRAALEVAARVPAPIDRAEAGDWLEARLAESAEGRATVVYHSIVEQYLAEAERMRVQALVRAAGERATATAPVGWLRMEPDGAHAGVWLDLWPPGRHARIAEAGYHGRPVTWYGWGP